MHQNFSRLRTSVHHPLLSRWIDDCVDEEQQLADAWTGALLQTGAMAACCSPALTPQARYFAGNGWPSQTSQSALAEISGSHGTSGHRKPVGGFVIRNAHVVNPGEPLTIADLLLKDGRIECLQAPGEHVPVGYQELSDCNGHWVIPGLIDMHVHLPSDNVLKLTPHFMRMFIAHGVTGVRETGDVDGTALPAARRWLQANPGLGPRIAASFYFVGRPPFRWKNSLHYEQPSDADRIIEQLVRKGASCIKLYENLREEDVRILQQAAHSVGLVVLGHVPTRLRYEQASISDTQHFFGVPLPETLRRDHVFSRTADWESVDDARLETVAAHAETHKLANTPTLTINRSLLGYRNGAASLRAQAEGRMPSFFRDVIWHPERGLPVYRGLQSTDFDALERAFEKKRKLFGELHRRGCMLLPGTDTMQPYSIPGYSLHRELENFVDAGMSPERALKAATADAANRLGWHDRGRIAAGHVADLVVCDANPAADIRALQNIRHVIVEGRPISKSSIDADIEQDLQSRETTFRRLSSRILASLAMRQAARRFTA